MGLKEKRIIITGGASGIGLELVKQLTDENDIIIIARNSNNLTRFSQQYPNVKIFKADLSDPVMLKKAAKDIVEQYKEIDGLINNAALQYTPQFPESEFKFDQIANEISINFTSPCQLCFLLLPALLKGNEPFILNINSGLGLVPKTGSAIYCATKGGLNIFSQALRNQLEKTNIDVLQAFLPLVDTPMTKGRGTGKLPPDKTASHIIKGINRRTPDNDIGKVKILRAIARLSPGLAQKIMKSA